MNTHTPGFIHIGHLDKKHNDMGMIRGIQLVGQYAPTPCKADAERMVACWNFCDGIPSELLQAGRLALLVDKLGNLEEQIGEMKAKL